MSAIGYVMQDRAGVYVWTSEWSGHLTRFLKKRMRTIADAAIRFAETVRIAVKSEKENSVSVSKEEVNRQAERMLTDYGNSILRLAYTYLHNYSDAEEVVQDTLIQFLRTAPQLMGTEHEKAWLLHVAANLSKNRIAYNKVRAADELSETLAAGLVVLIAACAVMPAVLTKNGDQNPDQTPDENVQVTWDYQEYDSAQALSAQMGYEVSDLKALPFEPQTVVYASIGTDLAQIEYETGDISVCYRKSPGTEENSGDYNQYEKLDTVSAGDCQVELRGSEDGYVLAVWTDGAYAYSLSFSQAQPKDVWMRLLEENQWN